MSSDKVFLTKEEQLYLMAMFEVDDPETAVEKFAQLMAEERADPMDLQKYLKKIMKSKKKIK